MLKLKQIHAFYIIVVSYILLNTYVFLFDRGMFYPVNMIPVFLLIIFLAFTDIEKVMYLMAFSTPLAITLKELGMSDGLNLSLPSEPLMIGMTILYLLNQLSSGVTIKEVLKHPLTVIILIQLSWMIFTNATSELPVISLKYILSRIWFLTSCYFIATYIFRNFNSIKIYILAYAVALAIVAIITTVKHAAYGFDEKTADWIVSPFYNDHTAYGAVLAMFIPVMGGMLFMKTVSFPVKVLCLSLLGIFLISIVVSYARAGWLSLAVSLGVLATLILRIKFRTLLITIFTTVILFLSFQSEIIMILGKNNTDSDGDFMANIESMTNISTDVSNMERLNRWYSAIKIFEEYPYLGTGPGTYQFLYAPYQKSSLITEISTNFGNKGNAHSEYLGPLSEQGILGAIIVLILVFYIMHLGYRLVYEIKDRPLKIFTISIVMGISTYFVHGLLNNFLDSDKASVPFWGFLAILLCIDMYHKKQVESQP
ncbi:MAG: O-antigen ligase family protein [Bacteroidota bacterium]